MSSWPARPTKVPAILALFEKRFACGIAFLKRWFRVEVMYGCVRHRS
jgi:hypothetical protein